MNYEELISVIIPVYQCEKYLSECITSILNQTYKNFELLLINDGSFDNSGMICDDFANKDNRIRVFHQENQGVAQSRQNGINKSKGKYITFIDSDDFIDADYLEVLYNKIIKTNSDIVCCNSRDIGNAIYDNNMILVDEEIEDKKRMLSDYFQGKRYAYCVWGKLYKKESIQNLKFRTLKYGEDTCFILDLFNTCNKICLYSYCGYNYRCQEQGISMTINNQQMMHDLLERDFQCYLICKEKAAALLPLAEKNYINRLCQIIKIYSISNEKKTYDFIIDNFNYYIS
ncbi:glycosyltransferase family 2 protein, partial [uncultured Clostridium sp.]